MINLVKQIIAKHASPELWRYLIMAIVLVGVEVATFQLMIVVGISYVIATPVSMIIAIILNWYLSRVFVFNHRPHTIHKEFMLVVIASVIGLMLQMAVTIAVVELAKAAPLIGKLIAICATFFWNFWFRKKYIFFNPRERDLPPVI